MHATSVTLSKPRLTSAHLDRNGVHAVAVSADSFLLRSRPSQENMTQAATPVLAMPPTPLAPTKTPNGHHPALSAATLNDWILGGHGAPTALRHALQEHAEKQQSEACRPLLRHTLQMMLALANRCEASGHIHQAQALALEVVLRSGWRTQIAADQRILGHSLQLLGKWAEVAPAPSVRRNRAEFSSKTTRPQAFGRHVAHRESRAALAAFVRARSAFEAVQPPVIFDPSKALHQADPSFFEPAAQVRLGLDHAIHLIKACYDDVVLGTGFAANWELTVLENLSQALVHLATTDQPDAALRLRECIHGHAMALWHKACSFKQSLDEESAEQAYQDAFLLARLVEDVQLKVMCLHKLTAYAGPKRRLTA